MTEAEPARLLTGGARTAVHWVFRSMPPRAALSRIALCTPDA